ncbi:Sterol 3-beta-glucosyltransferase, variant 2 [Balamuthia mandrillaris]
MYQQQQPPPQQGGQRARSFLSNLGRMFEGAVKEVGKGIDKLGETVEQERKKFNDQAETNFQREFEFPPTERLLGVFGCNVLNGTVGMAGVSYVSTNHFSFKDRDNTLKIILPFERVQRIQKAQAIKQQQGPPVIVPVEPMARGDCVQFFTDDNLIHTFFTDMLTHLLGPLSHRLATFTQWYALILDAYHRKTGGAAPRQPTAYAPQQQQQQAPPPLHHQQHQQAAVGEEEEEEQKEKERDALQSVD